MSILTEAGREQRKLKLIEEIENRFTYHAPFGDQFERYGMIRTTARAFALTLVEFCQDSRELSLALTKLDEVVMWANAAIARNERETKPCSGRMPQS